MTEIRDIDVLIIGAGINGCGTFRDLCAQGVDCVMIDRGDFCTGASAASSRLMHGGLKYLETGEFRLVRESLTERNRLLRNAAHYVRPLPTVLPVRAHWPGILPSIKRFLGFQARIAERGSLITRLGLTLYDLYGRTRQVMPNHRMLGRRALARRVSDLDAQVVAAGLYYEARLSHAERLGLELVLDGLDLNPRAQALNHTSITGVSEGVVTCASEDGLHRVRPRLVVNAGGAWIDAVNAALGLETALMGGSKGSHLVVDNPALRAALNGHMVYFGTADGRVNLVYPFEDKVMIGSTDIPVPDPDAARCDAREAAYLLASVREIFPGIALDTGDIRYRFCGVRPLPAQGGEIGLVTRDHSIAELALEGGAPVLCLIGGKWTTFRAFSEQATDRILDLLGRARAVSTEDMEIGGGRDYPRDAEARAAWIARMQDLSGLDAARLEQLLARYGTRAAAMVPDLAGERPLEGLGAYTDLELAWLCRHERVRHLADLLRRRTLIAMTGSLNEAAIEACANVASGVLGWDMGRRAAEIAQARDLMERRPRAAPGGQPQGDAPADPQMASA